MTLKVTTYFRFDVSASELHLNVFHDQPERERERHTSCNLEMKHFLGFFSFFCCQRNSLLSFFVLTIQVTNYRVNYLGEKGKNQRQQQKQTEKSRKNFQHPI